MHRKLGERRPANLPRSYDWSGRITSHSINPARRYVTLTIWTNALFGEAMLMEWMCLGRFVGQPGLGSGWGLTQPAMEE